MRSVKSLAAAFLVALLSAGCGSGAPTTCRPDGTSVDVIADGTQFDPRCVAVPADQAFRVTLSNDGSTPHNFTVRDGGEIIFSVGVDGGETETADGPPMKAGTYKFFCTLHPGMEGTLIVA